MSFFVSAFDTSGGGGGEGKGGKAGGGAFAGARDVMLIHGSEGVRWQA